MACKEFVMLVFMPVAGFVICHVVTDEFNAAYKTSRLINGVIAGDRLLTFFIGLARETLRALENAWINEKLAPEILPHREDLIDPLLQCISDMERNLKGLEKGDMRITIHTMELSRIRFLISSYLRTRLEKIEKNVIQILTEENEKIANHSEDLYLTAGELKFAQDYFVNFETLFRTVALKHMPNNFQEFEYKKFCIKPNLQAHVFLKANKDINGIIIPNSMDDQVDFETGSQHIIQYGTIAKFVKSGHVQLI